MRVLKIGGHDLASLESIKAAAVALARVGDQLAIVHGGGPRLDALQARLEQPVRKLQGLRVTDAATLDSALMVLCGQVNKQLVAALNGQGVQAIGLCGVDAASILVEKLEHPAGDLGFVGEVVSVRADFFRLLLDRGITPVVAPLSLGPQGQIYNVNGDQIASALAAALGADELVLASNVPGVSADGGVLARLTERQAQALIRDGQINGGMIPKVQAALEALARGVTSVRVSDLAGMLSGGGTLLTAGHS